MKNSQKFNERLRFLVKDLLNETGSGVAEKLQMNKALMNRYLKGVTTPSVEFVEKLCLRYSISSNWLIMNIGPVYLVDCRVVDHAETENIVYLQDNKMLAEIL